MSTPAADACHPNGSIQGRDSNSTSRKEIKNARILKSFPSSCPKELRQLIRHRGIHLGRIQIIEVLRTANGLGLCQHLLDERRELYRANGIVVEYLVGVFSV